MTDDNKLGAPMSVTLNSISTRSLLAAKHSNEPLIPLEVVATTYLGLTASTAKRKARINDLPFPVIRFGYSQKAPWLVDFNHLVAYVERAATESQCDWLRMQA
ncbi:pyocin activator PrtN family protein [Vibrio sp. L3-7]|uniref:pyocin activator PrtN family protein n=1 Tax=Vibrio sp. L3-7 TaxID=2912253 RepID=UPI001F2DC862|nr:pyocin activator PrtN family protein [Vibrio sp. L3-7]MCF7504092.1 pyocin activator PrtN family protein [Vibrio sp. L3-7]